MEKLPNIINRTLLLYLHEIPHLSFAQVKLTTPILDIKIYQQKEYQQVKKFISYHQISQKRNHRHYDRFVVLFTKHQSNARRKRLINIKRSSILDLINTQGKKNQIYKIQLSQINEYIPDQELLSHLSYALHYKPSFLQTSTFSKVKNESETLKTILFPYNHLKWMQLMKQRIGNRNISVTSLNDSYLQTQVKNLYKLQFSLLPQQLYFDIRDFVSMLDKFNFVRFFNQSTQNNQFKARKYVQRLIKTIKWRTKQTQQYLLILYRSQNWNKFLITVSNFLLIYQKYYLQNKQSKFNI